MKKHILLILIGSLVGCAPAKEEGDGVIKACILPADQTGTLNGRWKTVPVPVAFHQGDFSPDEGAAMIRAMDTWNKFYSSSLKIRTIDYGPANSPRQSTIEFPASTGVCNQRNVNASGDSYTAPVVIYKQRTWSSSYNSRAMAITTWCRDTTAKPPIFTMATMELNYQYYFNSGQQIPDLETIVAHELGHLAGLEHSCDGSRSTGVPYCTQNSLPSDHPYKLALMFPFFSFYSNGAGEVKRTLAENDQGRANCLYK